MYKLVTCTYKMQFVTVWQQVLNSCLQTSFHQFQIQTESVWNKSEWKWRSLDVYFGCDSINWRGWTSKDLDFALNGIKVVINWLIKTRVGTTCLAELWCHVLIEKQLTSSILFDLEVTSTVFWSSSHEFKTTNTSIVYFLWVQSQNIACGDEMKTVQVETIKWKIRLSWKQKKITYEAR